MIYFANPCNERVRDAMRDGRLGFIDTPAQGNAFIEGIQWCADNGCYGKGYPGDDEWIQWLRDHPGDRDLCLFATAPDVVGNYAQTEARSRPWLEKIRAAGFPAALVAQDGMEWSTWDPWDEIDALFIGGTTEWKLSEHARVIAEVASSLGKWVHMGRVSSLKRTRYAKAIGCDSVDGTILTFAPDRRLPEVLSWVHEVGDQTAIDMELT